MNFGFYYGIPPGFFFFLLVTLLIIIAMAVCFTYLALAAIVSPGALVTMLIASASGIEELTSSQLWTGAILMSVAFAFALWRYYGDPHRAFKKYIITAAATCLVTWIVGSYAPENFIIQQSGKMVIGIITSNAPPPQQTQTQTKTQNKPVSGLGEGIVNSNNVNLREEPSLNGTIFRKINAGTQVVIMKEKEDWYMVGEAHTFTIGWVSKQFIDLKK